MPNTCTNPNCCSDEFYLQKQRSIPVKCLFKYCIRPGVGGNACEEHAAWMVDQQMRAQEEAKQRYYEQQKIKYTYASKDERGAMSNV